MGAEQLQLIEREPKRFLHYLVTAEGEIFNTRTGERKYTWMNKGRGGLYERVQFWIDGKKKNYYVHRLMAELFLPGWDPAFVVNHIDGNSLNNDLSNLELGSQSYNIYEAYWLREVRMKCNGRVSGVIARVGTVNAVRLNPLMEC